MRPVAWALAASLALAGVAHATQDDFDEINWIAAWADQDAFVVERTSWSPEDDSGRSNRTWWVIEKPAGVAQAVIHDPYDKRPWLARPKKSTVPADKLAAVVAGLEAANRLKPRPKPAAVRKDVAPTLGITGIESVKTCPAKIKVGKKRVSISIDAVTADGGASRFVHPDVEMNWDRGGPSVNAPPMKPTCYPHAGGVLVAFKLHASMEGDNYQDRIAYLPGATLP